MAATMKDIAKAAGTSVAAVSYALNDKPGVGESQRKRILKIARKINYRPHRTARRLALKSSGTLGFVIADLRNGVYVDVFRLVETHFREQGYQVFLTDSELDVEKEKMNLHLMLDNRVEAMVIIPTHESCCREGIGHLISLKDEKVPFVLMGRVDDGSLDFVACEEANAARQLIHHLLSLGHRQIAFVGYDPNNRAAMERWMEVKGCLCSVGYAELKTYKCDVSLPPPFWIKKIGAILRRESRPTALVMVNDITGVMAIQQCGAKGLSVPKDISVIGFGNLPSSDVIAPALTTCAEDVHELSRVLIEVLTQKIANPDQPCVQRLVPQKILIRGSSGPCPKKIRSVSGTEG